MNGLKTHMNINKGATDFREILKIETDSELLSAPQMQ